MSQFEIPTRIESDRLILRQFREDDWRGMHAHYSNPECTRHTLGRVLSEGESWRLTATLAGHWLLRGYGPYALEDKASGVMVGTAGLWYPADFPEREIKWALLPEFQGRGYASEAARAVQAMAAAAYPGQPPISFIHRDNQASIRVAVAVGAGLENEVDFRGGRFRIYRHPAG
ncbi:GNAT family N-acetyltransferase [uncultured Dechloromonas sp.]|uniref:GNAT family N-acetyltransferase n=1 Tax=uncultured Dechloromonas sp. TaxID=171719 RepID=UPI0025FBCB45|nr:GNAT family N-acetyltransferase [uncultured Dechloromonas sp.]